jgi:hypothetical protein
MSATPAAAVETRLLRAHLRGSARERGRQHGEIFGARVAESGILDFYRNFCGREVFSLLPKPVGALLDRLHGHFAGRHSAEVFELARGFSEGSGIDSRRVLEGLAMPDVLNFLVGVSGRMLRAPTLGCTSAAAWGAYTPDGRLLYARNLDFPGNGIFERFPLVCRHSPDQGIPYVSIGTAGGIADGITGINEEGLSVALHQHYTAEAGYMPSGRPILDLGVEVLKNARDLSQAVSLCESWPATSGWSLVLTHWKTKQACVVHKTARRTAVVHSQGDCLVHTNTFQDLTLRSTELLRPAFYESSRLRRKRALQILEQNKGRVEVSTLAGLLNDRLDPDRNLVRAFGQAIHQPYTVTSVIMDPERGQLWVSEGKAPVCEGPYRRLPLWEESISETTLAPADPLPPQKRQAYGHYLSAYAAWQDRRDAAQASRELKAAVAGDAEDPIYRHMAGLLALKTGDFKAAEGNFAAGAEMPDIPHRRQAARFWRARTLDLLGRRTEAVKLYESIAAQEPYKPLLAAAEKGKNRPYRPSSSPVLPDFIYGDAYAY